MTRRAFIRLLAVAVVTAAVGAINDEDDEEPI